MTGLEELAALWRRARRVVVLTGAGLSTASGIPDFRSPGGRWERYRPVPLPEFLADEDARERYWRYKGETWQLIRTALPNAGHRALTDLALAGRLHLLVTQNVERPARAERLSARAARRHPRHGFRGRVHG